MRVALILLAGTLGFFLTLVLHIFIWRLCRPTRQIILLAIVFILLPLVGYLRKIGDRYFTGRRILIIPAIIISSLHNLLFPMTAHKRQD